MRLADVDALINDVMERYCKDCERRKGIKNGRRKVIYDIGDAPCKACAVGDMIDDLDNAPTVDPVKHWHWKSSQGLAEVGEVQCPNCKTIYYADDLYNVGETDENGIGQALMPNYCPHCGAKMEVEDETC